MHPNEDVRYHFTAEQLIPYPLEEVFLFFADPANLPRLMPTWQAARIEDMNSAPPLPPPVPFPGSERVAAGTGTKIIITARPFPFSPVRGTWVAVIEDFQWLKGFCDIQLQGPFKYWRHCHTLTPEGSGTHLRDSVEYELPLGPLSGIANALFVKQQFATMFRYRQRRTLELLAQRR